MEVRSCHLPALGFKARGKGMRAVVSLCQLPRRSELQPGARARSGGGACLLVSTMKDRQGTRYEVSGPGALCVYPLLTSVSAGVTW